MELDFIKALSDGAVVVALFLLLKLIFDFIVKIRNNGNGIKRTSVLNDNAEKLLCELDKKLEVLDELEKVRFDNIKESIKVQSEATTSIAKAIDALTQNITNHTTMLDRLITILAKDK